MRKDKPAIIALRRQGKSYSEISKLFHISKSTLSYWLRDIAISKSHRARLQRRTTQKSIDALILRNKYQTIRAKDNALSIRKIASKRVDNIDLDALFYLGVALYWGEGYKKGAEGSKWKCVDFTNSDPSAAILIMQFFRKVCHVPNEKFRIQLALHTKPEERQIKKFWSEILDIPESQFIKTAYTMSRGSKRKSATKLLYGTIHIRVYDVKLFFTLIGWIDGLKNKFKFTGV